VPLSEDLDRLDSSIRQLQVKWEMFFAGTERKPPSELQAQVEALIRRYGNVEIRNNGERFRYQGLSARFASFSELWQKRLRAREEGKVFGLHGLRAERVLPVPPSPAPQAAPPREAAAGEFRVMDARRDEAAVRALYETFVATRQRSGEAAAPSFDSFSQLIAQQTERIRSDKGARAVDFRLESKDGKVTLKARVVK
jgi:hypothetical protein